MATKQFRSATQDDQGRWWATSYDAESGETSQVQVMPEAGDDGTMYRPVTELERLAPGANGLWNPTDLQKMVDLGGSVPVGATFAAPTTAKELASWGFAGGGASPDSNVGLNDYLSKTGTSLQDFQTQTGGLPLVFHADGTATYDPNAQKQSFSYTNPDDGLFHKIAPLLFTGLATGGFGLAGTGATAAGGGAAELASMADLGSSMLGESIATGAAGGAGAGAGAFETVMDLGNFSNPFQVPSEGFNFADTFNPILESGPVNPINTNLGAGGMNTIEEMIAQIASGGEATLGTVGAGGAIGAGLGTAPISLPGLTQPPAPVQNITTPGTAPGTTNVPAGTMTTATTGAGSVLSNLLGGNGTTADWLRLAGTIGSGLLGAYSADKQGDAIKNESARLDAIQAPWRGKLSDMYANPGNFLNSAPVRASIDQGTQATARALSTQYGNPALAPNAVAEISKYANNSLYDKWGAEANRLAAFGGMNFPATASSTLNVQGADANNGVYDSIGYTLGQLTAPQQMTVADLLRQMNSGNVFGGQTVRV